VKALSGLADYQEPGEAEDEKLYTTSVVEYAMAVHLRDTVEHILSSGVDPFDKNSV